MLGLAPFTVNCHSHGTGTDSVFHMESDERERIRAETSIHHWAASGGSVRRVGPHPINQDLGEVDATKIEDVVVFADDVQVALRQMTLGTAAVIASLRQDLTVMGAILDCAQAAAVPRPVNGSASSRLLGSALLEEYGPSCLGYR